ncbi:dATP/dGTP diphosphohydrolase domain-containing protein [Mesorhizobium sp. M4B.F.Ca.ET.058.02.1.1]|uniref:dATP/dGTP diphosphohydrolase domain-containing protein n=1 Tax=Mesorhizobium sp. M4B.F.Ca.ET.058.02.1.1 TaxID=2493675 RepID=UPI00167EBCA3|nr:dATP/dGTP diphosphohydrolase domain-containing protein [Mesorhizobium sp. M4B.F.Ca.ET.058.02.1.1]
MNAPVKNQEFKADGGKLLPSLLLEGVPRALMLIIAVLSYGAQKYEAHSWKRVEAYRYKDAKLRHMFDELAGLGITDPESGLLHLAHEACNILFLLEMKLMNLPADEFQQLLRFNAPPMDHKVAAAKAEAEAQLMDLSKILT